jgi:hypothetical protein
MVVGTEWGYNGHRMGYTSTYYLANIMGIPRSVFVLVPTTIFWDCPMKHTNNYGKSQFFTGKSTISMAIFNSKLFVYQRVHTVFDFAPGFVENSIVIHTTDHSNRSEFLTSLNKVEDCSSHPPNNMIVIGYHQQILTIYHLLIHEYTLIIVITCHNNEWTANYSS